MRPTSVFPTIFRQHHLGGCRIRGRQWSRVKQPFPKFPIYVIDPDLYTFNLTLQLTSLRSCLCHLPTLPLASYGSLHFWYAYQNSISNPYEPLVQPNAIAQCKKNIHLGYQMQSPPFSWNFISLCTKYLLYDIVFKCTQFFFILRWQRQYVTHVRQLQKLSFYKF